MTCSVSYSEYILYCIAIASCALPPPEQNEVRICMMGIGCMYWNLSLARREGPHVGQNKTSK